MRCNARLKRWNWLETEYNPSFFLWKIPHPSSFRNFKANKLLYLRRSQKAYFLINKMLVILQQTVWVFKYYTVILLMDRPPSFHNERIAGVNPISEMGSVVDCLGMPQCPASRLSWSPWSVYLFPIQAPLLQVEKQTSRETGMLSQGHYWIVRL